MPVFVASRTASTNLSYLGLNVNVKAQSIILPENESKKLYIFHNMKYENDGHFFITVDMSSKIYLSNIVIL